MKYIRNTKEFENAIKIGETTESLFLDFKEKHNDTKDLWPQECALDISQFANTLGGTLLYGIVEAKQKPSDLKRASRIVGVNDAEKIKQALNTTTRNYLHPANLPFEIFSIDVNNIIIVSVNIPPLEIGCSFVKGKNNADSFLFPYRTEFGKKYMQPYQVEERMADKSRAIKIKMKRLCDNNKEINIITSIKKEYLSTKVNITGKDKFKKFEVIEHSEYGAGALNIRVQELGDNEFILLINSRTIHIPYSFVNEVWDMDFNKTGLALNCVLIVPSFDSPVRITFANPQEL